jgi:4-hydroxy-tetrahydrodipicolinate synthase
MPLTPDVLKEKIKAVVIVQTTPFNKDGSLDLEGLKANTRFLVDRCAGKRFVLVPTGSTGEAYTLSDAERMQVIEAVIDCAGGKLPVLGGTGAAGTDRVIGLSQAAERAGADGVQVVLPYYHVPSEEGLVRHYRRIGDALNIGIVIYNNAAVSKLWMAPHLMARCAEHPNIIGDKENTSDPVLFKAMRDAIDPAKMTVLCGIGEVQFACEAALGCPGFVTSLANLAPELTLSLLEAADRCDFAAVRLIMKKIEPWHNFIAACARNRGRDPWVLPGFAAGHIYVGVTKAAMDILGFAGGPVRGPGDDLTTPERDQLRTILSDIGLLADPAAVTEADA